MTVLQQREGCTVRRPVVALVKQDALEHADGAAPHQAHVDTFVLDVAGEVEKDAEEEVTQLHLESVLDILLEQLTQHREEKVEHLIAYQPVRDEFNAVLVRGEIKQNSCRRVEHIHDVALSRKEEREHTHYKVKVHSQNEDTLHVRGTQLEHACTLAVLAPLQLFLLFVEVEKPGEYT